MILLRIFVANEYEDHYYYIVFEGGLLFVFVLQFEISKIEDIFVFWK